MSHRENMEMSASVESSLSLPPGVFAHKKVHLTRDPKMVYGVGETEEDAVRRAVTRLPMDGGSIKELINSGTFSVGDLKEGEAYIHSGKKNQDKVHGESDNFKHIKD